MGYCYSSAGQLVCDECGKPGARKRLCPLRAGRRYCPAPALCRDCYRAAGGRRIHDRCAPLAAEVQRRLVERQQRLAAGDFERRVGYGSWCPTVPSGMVGGVFSNGAGQCVFRLVPADEWQRHEWLSEFVDSRDWCGPPAA